MSEYYHQAPGNSNFNSNVMYKFGTGLDGRLDELNIRMHDSIVGSENYIPDLPSSLDRSNGDVGSRDGKGGLKKVIDKRFGDYKDVRFNFFEGGQCFRTRI
jgi:hypothetical protein